MLHLFRSISSPGEGSGTSDSHLFPVHSSSPAVAMGFLSIDKVDEMANPCDTLQIDLGILQHMFPTFPLKMLRILLVREEGNATEVAKSLRLLGWGHKLPKKGSRIDMGQNLSNQRNEHFEVPYFWGEFSEKLSALLLRGEFKATGVFFTAVEKPNRYIVVYLSKSLEVRKRDIAGPLVPPMQLNLYGLKRGLPPPEIVLPEKLLCCFAKKESE